MSAADPIAATAVEAANEKASESSAPEQPTVVEPETPAPAAEALVKVRTAIRDEEAKTGKKLVPFLEPPASCKPAPTPALTADQEAKYEALLTYCNEIKTLPVSTEKTAESRELDDVERMWLTRECLLRFLRATKWDVEGAKKRLETTLVWRREYGLRDHTPEYISPENETGKQVILGYDNECRPCLYLAPSAQNTERSARQIQHLVFMLERVIDLMPAGQETLALLVNFGASTKSSNPSISQGREVLNILQNHYPERLGRALCINRTSISPAVHSSVLIFAQFLGSSGASSSSSTPSSILWYVFLLRLCAQNPTDSAMPDPRQTQVQREPPRPRSSGATRQAVRRRLRV
jgi:hypothetical protein